MANCPRCEDGGDCTAFFDRGWNWRCDSCGLEWELTTEETDDLLNPRQSDG